MVENIQNTSRNTYKDTFSLVSQVRAVSSYSGPQGFARSRFFLSATTTSFLSFSNNAPVSLSFPATLFLCLCLLPPPSPPFFLPSAPTPLLAFFVVYTPPPFPTPSPPSSPLPFLFCSSSSQSTEDEEDEKCFFRSPQINRPYSPLSLGCRGSSITVSGSTVYAGVGGQ